MNLLTVLPRSFPANWGIACFLIFFDEVPLRLHDGRAVLIDEAALSILLQARQTLREPESIIVKLRAITILPLLSINPHFSVCFTAAKPSGKSPVRSHCSGTTIVPFLLMNPELPGLSSMPLLDRITGS